MNHPIKGQSIKGEGGTQFWKHFTLKPDTKNPSTRLPLDDDDLELNPFKKRRFTPINKISIPHSTNSTLMPSQRVPLTNFDSVWQLRKFFNLTKKFWTHQVRVYYDKLNVSACLWSFHYFPNMPTVSRNLKLIKHVRSYHTLQKLASATPMGHNNF